MKKTNVKTNFVLQILYQVLLIIAPLLTAPYVARVLGPNNLGINSYAYAITTYFAMFASLGLENYGSRLVAQNKGDSKKLNIVFSELFFIHTLLSMIVYLIFWAFCFWGVKNDRIVFIIQSFYILGAVLDINWLFFGLEEFKSIVLKNCVIKISSVVLTFCLVHDENDTNLYIFILAFSTFLNYVILWINARKYVSFVKVYFKDTLKHVIPLFVLFMPSIAILLYKYMDKIMLGSMKEKTYVAFYDSGERIIVLALGVINALGIVMLPRISVLVAEKNEKKIQQYFEKSLFLISFVSIGAAFGAFALADMIIPFFFGRGYEPGIIVMKILAFSIPFSAVANVVKSQYILPNKKDLFFAIALACGAALNLIINAVLIPIYDVAGAAIGTLITEVFVCTVQVVKSNKRMKTFRLLLNSWGFIIPALGMLLSMNFVIFENNIVICIGLKFILGLVIYIMGSLIYVYYINKELVFSFVSYILKLLKIKK